NLANCYSMLRNTAKAVEEARRGVQIVPKSAPAHSNLSLFASYGDDFQTGEKEAHVAQQINPNYAKGYIALAFAHLGLEHVAEAQDAYPQLEKISAWRAASGLADLAIYEGRFKDALGILTKAAAVDAANPKSAEPAADKFAALAYTQLA